MIKDYLILVMFFFLTSAMIYAQVSGSVIDDSGVPLPGVSIVLKWTSNETTTDFDGNYSINAGNGDILVFSFVGYDTQEITISRSTLNVTMKSGVALDEVVLLGSRAPARTAIESAVPVDIIDMKELVSSSPQVNLNQILNYVAPSFSSNTQTISDGTDHIDPASLRGLGPDQVLVLINGKRRHTSSLVNINGTFGRGSVGTDLNAIPAVAIKRIEVLRDGAAAQYGSDAIAGVINIVLNESVNELSLNVTSGANFSRNAEEQKGGVDGETVNVSANYGLPLGDKGGFINFSGDFDYREHYSRMKEWEGSIFNAYNSIEWVASQSGVDLYNLSLSDIQFYAQGVTYFDLATKNAINNAGSIQDLIGIDAGVNSIAGPLSQLTFDDNEIVDGIEPLNTTNAELIAREQQRTDYNMRVGQSELRSGRFFANLSLPLDDNGTKVYAFAGLGSRNGNSAGFYRLPNQNRTYTPLYINGFLPEINSKIKDKSLAVGIRGKIKDWDIDFSNTWGENSFLFEISNTSNASLETASPTRFDAGGFSFAQNTTNLDLTHHYGNIFNGLNVAFGGEYRIETYEIVAGEEESYTQYNGLEGIPTGNGILAATDFFGRSRPGGSQVFPGFSLNNELSRERNSIAGYLDFEADITDKWLLGLAARFENYSDFGSTINYKIATRYKITENINVRAAVNTGFRAPSLQQLNFNSVSTVFVDGIPTEVGTFTNDSDLAKQLGIPELKEEESRSLSVGVTAKIPTANLTVTVDGYWIGIEDRIVYTGQFEIPNNITTTAETVAFFANAIDTESKGLDIVITQKANLNDKITLKSDLSATFSQTRQVDDIHASPLLANQLDTYFDQTSKTYIEEAVPRTKVNLSNNLSVGKFNAFLRNVYFGKVTEATNVDANRQEFDGKLVTDLSFGFEVTDNFTITVGANNLFDIYPDRNIEANRFSSRFDWSRRSQQFGIGGRFLFARLSFILT